MDVRSGVGIVTLSLPSGNSAAGGACAAANSKSLRHIPPMLNLVYRRVFGAGGGNRTPAPTRVGSCSATELQPASLSPVASATGLMEIRLKLADITRRRSELPSWLNPCVGADGTHEKGASDSPSSGRPVAPTFTAPQAKYCPPLAVIVEPVMKPASSDARNTTQRAISLGSPRRPTGICGRMFFSMTSAGTALTISVAM
jgi:hypothetical protein